VYLEVLERSIPSPPNAGWSRALTRRLCASSCRNQLINGFELLKIWSSNFRSPAFVSGGALACLEHAVVHRESYAIFLNTWNTFGPLKGEPRFQSLLADRARLAPSTCYGNRYSRAGLLWGKLHLSHRARIGARREP